MSRIIYILLILLFIGCVKARDYVSADRGAVRMNLVLPFGDGGLKKNYLKLGGVVIDKGESKADVRQKIGSPSQTGFTLDGYEFYRYADRDVEIYFHHNRVIDWKNIEFRP